MRVEDDALVRGKGRYTADLFERDHLVAVFLRSEHAHADITVVSTDVAKEIDGVRLVWTAADLPVNGPMPIVARPTIAEGSDLRESDYPLICEGRVRKLGDVIAMVVADTASQAQDAAEAIEVEYTPRPAVTDVTMAGLESAPLVWPEFGTNLAYESTFGDKFDADAAFEGAEHVVRLRVEHNRLVSNYMEPRAALAEFDSAAETWTLTLPSQGAHVIRNAIAGAMKIEPERMRVLTYDVGGGFGPKYFAYRDYPLLALAARELGQPVRWTSTRMEHFLADAHGRDAVVDAELAIDATGRILGMRNTWHASLGAYMSQYGGFVPWVGATMSVGVYDIPASYVHLRGYYTNATPTDAYRGAGRPEAALTIERLMDAGARACRMDPAEFRRRNFIRPEQMPYRCPTGQIYDSGEFEAQMDVALGLAGYENFPERLIESRKREKVRGIGMATYIEACAFPGSERAKLSLETDGTVVVDIGTQSSGQGHQTVYGQLVAEMMGLPLEQVEVRQGDSARLTAGGGTSGSRSIPFGVPALRSAAVTLVTTIKEVAAARFDTTPEAIEFDEGVVKVIGTNHALSLADLIQSTDDPGRFVAFGEASQSGATYPNGAHICEVEIDPETGRADVISLVVVDDFGRVINPTLLDGQIHGGVAQGLGQALLERTVYDGSGQLLSASLMDYAMPRADDIPPMTLSTRNVPSLHNEMGIKGGGEAGAIGATPAISNAVIDALSRAFGISDLACPATPERIWRAIQEAKRRESPALQ